MKKILVSVIVFSAIVAMTSCCSNSTKCINSDSTKVNVVDSVKVDTTVRVK